VATEIEALQPGRATGGQQQPRREKLPPHVPRREVPVTESALVAELNMLATSADGVLVLVE